MVVVLATKHLKFKINAKDHLPPHCHVEGGGASVRIDLNTFEVMDAETDFSQATVRFIIDFIREHVGVLREQWKDYHG